MVVFLSCQLFHKEVLRQSISHKYLMRGRWYVFVLSLSRFLLYKFIFLVLSSYYSIVLCHQPGIPLAVLSALQTERIRNQILPFCSNYPSCLPISFSSSVTFSSGFSVELKLRSHLSSSFSIILFV